MSPGQTGFVPTKWVCPRDKPRFSSYFTQRKPSLSLGQTQFVPGTFRGRRAADRVYVLKVYVPFSFPIQKSSVSVWESHGRCGREIARLQLLAAMGRCKLPATLRATTKITSDCSLCGRRSEKPCDFCIGMVASSLTATMVSAILRCEFCHFCASPVFQFTMHTSLVYARLPGILDFPLFL